MSTETILVATHPATIPAGKGAGSASKTVLTDGEVFFCVDCDFAGETYYAVRTHRTSHTGKQVGRPKGSKTKAHKPVPVARMSLAQIEEHVARMQESLALADARARRAEAALASIMAIVAKATS